ncbi:uncharacterized protein L3040_004651 [Drepanopeziza brunnea f. sp. 'multigermtubi']|uniref:uncharacterized protein n=1 Tax=Drepanopeziza brunnea f. sp. 'multigermtubi' TaxID=698441 RepID=UPI00238ADF1D|nr:hypothetical protein L3040_004651 [Drepanopeziza brunnea f. sp. 'multigermtubi']
MSNINLETPTAPGTLMSDLIDESASEQMAPAASDKVPEATTAHVAEATAKVKAERKGSADKSKATPAEKKKAAPVKKSKAAPVKKENVQQTDEEATGEEAKATPVEKAKAAPAKKTKATPAKKTKAAPAKTENVQQTGEESTGEEATSAEEPTTPKATAPKKKAPKKKPVTPGADKDVEMAAPATNGITKSAVKKRAAAKVADGETPTKKAKATPKLKAGGVKFPESWAEFSEEDKLIVNMRKSGKSWTEIEAAWTVLTGRKPGTDTTRKRFAKLEPVAQDFKNEDLPLICKVKKVIDLEIEASIKKITVEGWVKIASQVKQAGGGDYKGTAVERKFAHMKKTGVVDDDGNYIRPEVEQMENMNVDDDATESNDSDLTDPEDSADAMEN